jgi:diguanylate cyclase (GGDEF)-like protein
MTVRRQPAPRQRQAIRAWPVWELSGGSLAYILAVVIADVAAIAIAAATTPLRAADLELAAILLACSLATAELTRRAGEPAGLVKTVYGMWELPLALLLPPLYGLLVPVPRLVLTQLRVRTTVVYRRVFSAAALGLSYGVMSLTFHATAPAVSWTEPGLAARVLAWAAVAIACCVLRSLVNQVLVLSAIKGADRSFSMRGELLSRELLFNEAAEISVAVLLAYAVTGSPLMALVALPLVTLQHRSFRHAQLVSASRIDGKTGLLNATTWQEEARLRVAQAAGTAPLAVAIADIDHFKIVNDTFGHLAGDLVLAAVAGALKGFLREGDLIGRFGGEEFVILLPRTSAAEARQITERLRARVAQITTPADDRPGSTPLQVTISIGVAVMESVRRDLEDLLAAADHALYEAKQAGRNCVRTVSGTSQLTSPRPDLSD